jgi:hypothetical protein
MECMLCLHDTLIISELEAWITICRYYVSSNFVEVITRIIISIHLIPSLEQCEFMNKISPIVICT